MRGERTNIYLYGFMLTFLFAISVSVYFCGLEVLTGINFLLQLTSALIYLQCVLIVRYVSVYYSPNSTHAHTHINLFNCFKMN